MDKAMSSIKETPRIQETRGAECTQEVLLRDVEGAAEALQGSVGVEQSCHRVKENDVGKEVARERA